LDIFNFHDIIADMKSMEGLTLREISEQLGIATKTAQKRIMRAGIKPKGYAGPTALYEKSVVEKIRDVAPVGRPRKAAAPKPAKKAKK